MKAFLIFFRNFLSGTFRNKLNYLIHFVAPVLTFLVMYLLLRVNEKPSFAAGQAIGLVLYFTMIQAVMIVSLSLKDREQGVMLRILVSPAKRLSYVAGNGAVALVILTIQVLVLAACVIFLFRAPIGMDFATLVAILSVANFTGVGFAFLICALSDSGSSALMAANIVIMFSSLLGGAFFPVEFMSPFMRRLSFAFPQYWTMRAIRQVQAGESLQGVGLSLLILALFGLIFFVIQAAVARKRED
jgi:ABC-2 type transport system permease protein